MGGRIGRAVFDFRRRPAQALGDLGLYQVFFSQFMLVLPGLTMHKRNALGFRITVNPAAKTASHAHEVCVIQSLL